jgi:phosphoserine phosphatase
MSKRKVIMAIAYDFDGTLAPGNMQEHQFLPDIGMKPDEFWSEADAMAREHQADKVLVYMNLMLKKAKEHKVSVRIEDFKKRGKTIAFFDGVPGWFNRMNAYADARRVELRHYLISSGNHEIFAGTSVAKYFHAVYASKYLFDENGVAEWPALAINYTTKTQFLFRINKGAEDINDDAKVNEFVPMEARPIPFENMVFIGDGATDIPCFRLVKEKGGLSVAVYPPKKKGGRDKANAYRQDDRVHAAVPANYTEGSDIDRIIKARIDLVAARHALDGLLDKG